MEPRSTLIWLQTGRITGATSLSNVPVVATEMAFILEIQTDNYWADVTVDMRKEIRVKLRNLVELIKPIERKIVITEFEDEIGPEANVDLPDVGSGVDKGCFTMKVRKFLDDHANHIALLKQKHAEQGLGIFCAL